MNSKANSFFAVGLMTGVLIATVGFSLFVRTMNSRGKTTGIGGSPMVLKLAHTLDQKHPVHRAMERMAQLLKEKSADTVQLQIFPNGQLGSETECIEQLQHGALAITKTSAAPLENFVPQIAVFGIPYLFRDEEHFWKVIQGPVGKELLAAGQATGLRGLCYYDAGARSFYTVDRPILKPDDLRGLKIRVQQSKTAMDMVETLGGNPTPIPFGELYTALQSSLIDGAENNPPSFFSSRHFEVCKHFSLDEHTRVPDVLLISAQVWESLEPRVRGWISEAAEESALFQRELWAQENQKALQSVQDLGVQIHRPVQAAFAEQVKAMHQSYAGTPAGELMQRILER